MVPFFVICLAAVAMAGGEDPSDEDGGGNDEYQVGNDMDYDNETTSLLKEIKGNGQIPFILDNTVGVGACIPCKGPFRY